MRMIAKKEIMKWSTSIEMPYRAKTKGTYGKQVPTNLTYSDSVPVPKKEPEDPTSYAITSY